MEWVGLFFLSVFLSPADLPWCSDAQIFPSTAGVHMPTFVARGIIFFFNNEDTLDVSCMSTEQPKEFKYTFLYQKEVFQSPVLFLWIDI